MRKDLIITALLTFCLAAVMFTAIPTRSQGTLEYDPWKDINDDGKLDILDIVQISSQYGAQGLSPKSLNITNWPLDENGCLRVSTDGGSLRSGNDSERILVFSTEAQYFYEVWGYLGGVKLSNESKYAFSFNPIGSSYNVTGIYISIVVFADRDSCHISEQGPPTRLWVTINGQTEYQEIATEVNLNHLTTLCIAISSNELVESMRQGINSLQIAVQSYCDYHLDWHDDRSYELALFVEYEYIG